MEIVTSRRYSKRKIKYPFVNELSRIPYFSRKWAIKTGTNFIRDEFIESKTD